MQKESANGVNIVLLVGGFSESPMVQEAVMKGFFLSLQIL
jgi:molecular chaperone DnaK (HSP70)